MARRGSASGTGRTAGGNGVSKLGRGGKKSRGSIDLEPAELAGGPVDVPPRSSPASSGPAVVINPNTGAEAGLSPAEADVAGVTIQHRSDGDAAAANGTIAEAAEPAIGGESEQQDSRPSDSLPIMNAAADELGGEGVTPPPIPAPVVETPPQPPLLFEIGWEVCWQLGGIYTVLRSKAAQMLETWGDRYCLVGPYNPNTAPLEFEETPPDWHLRDVITGLKNEAGIPCYFGRWLIAGRPRVLLLDYRALYRDLDRDKFTLWKDHGIQTYASDGEVNEVLAFGFAVVEFFRRLCEVQHRPIMAHFHEWMAGVAVPRIAHLRLPVATVFTTHATLLGRYLAGDNPEFYNHLPFLNAEAEARKYGIYPRYQIEKAAAHASTVFTTVSEVTNFEAEKLLGRKPDAILPNGINIQRFAAPHEFQHLHRGYKEKIHEFVMGHFFPAGPFDLDRTLYLVTSGRYEYRNKGMDLYIESLWRLNNRLKLLPERPTVIAFIITKAPVRNVNVNVLQAQAMFDELRDWCSELESRMGQRMFLTAARGKLPTFHDLVTEDSLVRLKQSIFAWKTGRQPPIVTHDLIDDSTDPVMKHLRHRGLFNSPDDPVKIVFHPQFVTPTGPLINLDYESFVRGCHMGVFPSYYEPWGYTPMEAVALGLPAVTTDLSGFGAYVQRHVQGAESQGICVLNRRTKSFDQTADNLTDYLFDFCKQNRRQRIETRNRVERLSELFDWSALIRHYHDSHELAFNRVGVASLHG